MSLSQRVSNIISGSILIGCLVATVAAVGQCAESPREKESFKHVHELMEIHCTDAYTAYDMAVELRDREGDVGKAGCEYVIRHPNPSGKVIGNLEDREGHRWDIYLKWSVNLEQATYILRRR